MPEQLELFPASFEEQVSALLGDKASAKGYDGAKGDLHKFCKDLPHPLGEIIYKAIRYHRKGDPTDLVKIAAWARLVWEERGNKDGICTR